MHDDGTDSTCPQANTDDNWLNEAAVWWAQTLAEEGAGFRASLDAEAKLGQPERPEQVSPAEFKRYVEADLLAVIRAYACFMRVGMSDYHEAYNSARLYAWRRGAWGLSDLHMAELQDWIHDALAYCVEQGG